MTIIGGTGSFGNAVLNRYLIIDISEIRIFSRDKKKQDAGKYCYVHTMHHTTQGEIINLLESLKAQSQTLLLQNIAFAPLRKPFLYDLPACDLLRNITPW